MTHSDFRRQFYLAAATIGAALIAVMLASIKGCIPQRIFAWLLIGVVVIGYIAFYRLLKRARDERRAAGESDKPLDEATRRRYRSRIRSLKIFVAVLIFCLVYGLWSMWGDATIPLVARIGGPAVNILLNIYCIRSIRTLQRRLKPPAENRPKSI